MEILQDWRFWTIAALAAVWANRARRALITLRDTPEIAPIRKRSPIEPFGDDSEEISSLSPLVSIMVPAKNEQANIAACLDSLLGQDYAHHEIIVVNDNSTDATGAILESYRGRIQSLNAAPTPEGWTGKNFAIHSALSRAKGEWFLFTDADTRHEPAGLSAAMAHAQAHQLELLTLIPRCLTESFFEHLIQPCAMAHLGLWFPVEKVNHPKAAAYFGNGQYFLIRRETYEKVGGHEAVRGEFLEDFALSRRVKNTGGRMQLALGTQVLGTRMYPNLKGIWHGWRRIFLHAFERRAHTLFAKFAGVVALSVMPFAAYVPLTASFLGPEGTPFGIWAFAALVLAFILGTTWTGYGVVKARRGYALLLPAAAFLVALILLDAAASAASGRKTRWR